MEFSLPHQNINFEIPDKWLMLAGALGFSAQSPAFKADSDDEFPTTLVCLTDVKVPIRDAGIKWFHEERMISILKGIVQGNTLPPLEADEPPNEKLFRYRIRDDFHRYYASAALGFKLLPISLRPYFNLSDL